MTDVLTDHPSDEALSAYTEGDLDAATAADVEAHLEACERCSGLVRDLEQTRSLLANLSSQAAPERFAKRVETRIRRRSRGRFFDYRWQLTTYLGAAIVLVILAVLYFFTQLAFDVRDAETGRSGPQLNRDVGAD